MKPLVSVILPTYNEARHIESTIRSLLAQRHSGFELEILVIDGGSSDATVDHVVPFLSDGRVKLLRNPSRTAPAAFNIGLRAAAGEFVCVLGAHAKYSADYIETCYREMLAHDAVGCSGVLVTAPANDTPSARLAAWCLGHGFASSPNSVRTQADGFAETIPYPIFRKSALFEVGGYNEQLVRNQDNDMNHRLRAAGHKLYLTAKTRAIYLARPNIKSLWSYAYRSGTWNALTLRINAACMRLRHFVPLAFALCLAVLTLATLLAKLTHRSAFIPMLLLASVLGIHSALGLTAAVQTSIAERSMEPLLLPPVILGFHLAYGLGTLAASFSLLRGFVPAAKTKRATALNTVRLKAHGTSTTARRSLL